MLNRLLGIVYLLMNKETVTAAELAERFEVSVRTIYRDIEELGMAGIPIYTKKGRFGGISLTEQFVLNKMLVTKAEQKQILAALASLQETGAQEEEQTLRKMKEFFKEDSESWVSIDFSDWSDRRQKLYEQIKDAILHRKVIIFDYYGQNARMSHRAVEPIQLLFKEYTWYLRAFCRERQAMRLFKLLRMKRVAVTGQEFILTADKLREIGADKKAEEASPPPEGEVKIVVRIDASEAYRVYDRFEEEEITVLENGDFVVHLVCLPDNWIYGVLLTFGASAEVLEPETVRNEVRDRLRLMLKKYEKKKII